MAIQKRQVQIMGSSFYPGAGNWIAKLRPDQQLRVEREPTNKYDPNAVAVYLFQQKLGHFPRGFASEVAPLMDAGNSLSVHKSRDPRFVGVGIIVVEWEDGANASPPAAPQGDAPPD